MDGIYSNRGNGDFVRNAITVFGRNCRVRIASAFFSDAAVVKEIIDAGCTVEIIVRLGPGTSARELETCRVIPGVLLRYFTSTRFHPKVFIFGDTVALVGSANLTRSGLGSPGGNVNREISITIDSGDPRFDELCTIFDDLWASARVFSPETAQAYTEAEARTARGSTMSPLELAMAQDPRLGIDHGPGAPGQGGRNPVEFNYNAWLARWQRAEAAIRVVSTAYLSLGPQREPRLPPKIEIDQLFNFIRDKRAPLRSYMNAPFIQGADRQAKLIEACRDFRSADWPYLGELADLKYPKIKKVLGSRDSIDNATDDELFEALAVAHAFAERRRFFRGGLEGLKRAFLGRNDPERIKATLCHLIFGGGDYQRRMAECIYGDKKLNEFGKSCVQETFGWVGPEDVPICNERTLMALRWLGFDVYNEMAG